MILILQIAAGVVLGGAALMWLFSVLWRPPLVMQVHRILWELQWLTDLAHAIHPEVKMQASDEYQKAREEMRMTR